MHFHCALCSVPMYRWHFASRASLCVTCCHNEGPVRPPAEWDAGEHFSPAARTVWESYNG